MVTDEYLSSRTLGQYPLSIPTSLALESAFDIYPDRPALGKQLILDYDVVFFNLRTMYRNMIGSLQNKEHIKGIMPNPAADCLAEEIDMISSIIKENTNGKVKARFYYSNYANLATKFKHAVLRLDNTDKQKEFTLIHNQTMGCLIAKHKQEPLGDIKFFDLDIELKIPEKALIVTNYAYDLLSSRQFKKLTLLESHSGHFKDTSLFYTKYYEGNGLAQIPFRKDFLQIFGDSTLFRPMDIKLRRELIEIAKQYGWSSITSYDKLMYGINNMRNYYFRDTVKSIMSNH